MEKQIEAVVKEITDNYKKEDLLVGKYERRLPNREVIIGLIKDIRKLMFPGYFANDDYLRTLPEHFVGTQAGHIAQTLTEQVQIAFLYNNPELDKHAAKEQAREVTEYFLGRLPEVQRLLLKDVQAGFDGDPAAKSKEDIIISYPGLFAIFVYRIAHELYLKQVPLIPRIMTEYVHSRTGIDINSGATIGEYFFIDHGTGVVIGETTIIGDHVKLYQGVTLGALSTRAGQQLSGTKRHPTIEDNVTIYSGSTILGGNTTIGRNTVIGGNAFITESVDAETKVVVKNPEMTFKGSSDSKANEDIWYWVI